MLLSEQSRAEMLVHRPPPSPFPPFPKKTLTLNSTFLTHATPNSHSPSNENEILPKSAIQRITDKLLALGLVNDADLQKTQLASASSAGEIFLPSAESLPVRRVGHTIDTSWSWRGREGPKVGPGLGKMGKRARREAALPSVAELMIPAEELERLRKVGIQLEKKLKVGKPGVTEGIVNGIHERWRNTEVVKIKCDDLCKVNMKRTHEILERKTGGLVIWRLGSIIILYRRKDYVYPYFVPGNSPTDGNSQDKVSLSSVLNPSELVFEHPRTSSNTGSSNKYKAIPPRLAGSGLVFGVGSPDRVRFQLPGEMEVVEASDHLLEGLGPRFTDWWGYNPLPVDADLLPAVVTGYRKPFRLLPFGLRPKLTDREMTILRRLSRPLPCHFALGRVRNLQGLAAAMVKLWEKCEIAKVAVKRGVQNTNSELMAEELKRLTGGVLLSRDRECIVFYRGKDFLPLAVSNAIEERRKNAVLGERNGSYSTTSSSIGKPVKSEDESQEMKHATENRVEEKLASVTTQIDAELSSFA